MDVETVAKGLSEAQKRALLGAVGEQPNIILAKEGSGSAKEALRRKGLVWRGGMGSYYLILGTGLAVRALLKGE